MVRAESRRFGIWRGILRSAVIAASAVALLGSEAALGVSKTPIVILSSIDPSVDVSRHAIAADHQNLYVTYEELGAISLRHSTDGGATWQSAVAISHGDATAVDGATVAAAGGVAHLAWVETANDGTHRIWYRRSTDHASTWTDAIPLTAATTATLERTELYASGQRVVLVYVLSGREVVIRRSANQGISFAPAATIGTANAATYVSVAFGDQVIYLAWTNKLGDLRLRRSTTGGITWRTATTLGTHDIGRVYYWPWIAATGRYAIVAATRGSDAGSAIVLRITGDRGATWRPTQVLPKPSYQANFWPTIYRANGRWWLTVDACPPDACEATDFDLKTSPDGVHWSGQGGLDRGGLMVPAGVARTADGTIWYAWRGDTWEAGDDERVNVRGVR
jgi:hypothetical protein